MTHAKSENLKNRFAVAGRYGLSAALALAMLGIPTSGARAQQAAAGQPLAKQAVAQAPAAAPAVASVATPPVAKPTGEEEETATASKPGTEGIKIHGHWVIDLKNPDGTVVDHRDFQNSLVTGAGLKSTSGDQILAALLSGNATPGGFGVAFISGNTIGLDSSSFCNEGINPAQAPAPNGIQCYGLVEPGSILIKTGSHFSSTYNFGNNAGQTALTALVSFSPAVNIVLSGNFTILPAYGLTSISAVQSYVGLCAPQSVLGSGYRFAGSGVSFAQATNATNACDASAVGLTGAVNFGPLTSTIISTSGVPTPLSVTTGQVISVTVTISFS